MAEEGVLLWTAAGGTDGPAQRLLSAAGAHAVHGGLEEAKISVEFVEGPVVHEEQVMTFVTLVVAH